jgi:hypothetical protein
MTSHDRPFRRSSRWGAGTAIIALATLVAACGSSNRNAGTPGSSGTPTTYVSSTTAGGVTTTSVPATTAPSSTSRAALASALTSAYQAETGVLATYRNVLSKLGSVGPFPNIVAAEGQHVSTISTLLDHYAMTASAPSSGQASPPTLSAACSLGVTLEQQVIALYTDQIPKVSAYTDVTAAFQNLQAAARDNHLPAFQHCA